MSIFSGFKLQRGNSRGLSPPLIANIQGLKGSVEGEEVDREVSPSILKREREEEQPDSPLWVSGELGSPTVKPPPDTRSPEGGGGKMDIVGRNKHVEVKDPEDSSTMEESVVTFSRQRRKEPLVGDLGSSPESVGLNMEKREDAVLDMDIYHLERNGARENTGSNPEDVSTGEGMAAMLFGTGNTNTLVGYGTQSPEC